MKVRTAAVDIPVELRNMLGDERPASWKYLLPADRSAKVLFLSSSLASVPFGLARSFGSVTVAGPEPEDALILEAWAAEKRLLNLKIVAGCLPPHGRFDVIVVDGRATDAEKTAEMTALCEKRLKPGGLAMCLGAKSKTGLSARASAGIWKKAGWEVERMYALLPSMDNCKLAVPTKPVEVFRSGLEMHNTLTVPSRVKKLGVQICGSVGLLDRVLPGYAMMLSKGGTGRRGWRLKRYIAEKIGREDFDLIVHNASPGEGAKAILKAVDGSGRALAYVKVSDNETRGVFIKNEYDVLMRLSGLRFDTAVLPEPVSFDVMDGYHVMIVRASEEKFGKDVRAIEEAVVDFLIELFQKTSSVKKIEETRFREETKAALDEFVSLPYANEYGWLRDMAHDVFEELKGVALPFGVVHRDFVGWNVKRRTDGKLYVIDWEWSRQEHLPLQDFFHFILLTEWAQKNRSVEEVLQRAFFAKNARYEGLLRRYAGALDISIEKSYYLLILYVIEWTVFHIGQIAGVMQWASETLDFLGKVKRNELYTPEAWLKG